MDAGPGMHKGALGDLASETGAGCVVPNPERMRQKKNNVLRLPKPAEQETNKNDNSTETYRRQYSL
jgi:hypothetical protein